MTLSTAWSYFTLTESSRRKTGGSTRRTWTRTGELIEIGADGLSPVVKRGRDDNLTAR